MNYSITANTDVGIKKNTNQDSVLVKKYAVNEGECVFAVMCDGMGGLEKGEVASASLINAFNIWANEKLVYMINSIVDFNVIRNQWNSIIANMNYKIRKYGERNGVSLGTTVTAILLVNNRFIIVNVGDTRVYLVKNDDINIITKDQTLVQREVDIGKLTYEQAKTDPRRSVLLQCCGASDRVFPEYFSGIVEKDNTFMLCTDGFRHEVSIEEIYQCFNPQALMNESSMDNNSRWLIDLNKSRGEKDNISVILVRSF